MLVLGNPAKLQLTEIISVYGVMGGNVLIDIIYFDCVFICYKFITYEALGLVNHP